MPPFDFITGLGCGFGEESIESIHSNLINAPSLLHRNIAEAKFMKHHASRKCYHSHYTILLIRATLLKE